jgi:hypothetical protein
VVKKQIVTNYKYMYTAVIKFIYEISSHSEPAELRQPNCGK